MTTSSLLTLEFSEASLSVEVEAGDTKVGYAHIDEKTGSPVEFTVEAKADWLTIDPGRGQTPAELALIVDSTSLDEGTYTALVIAKGPHGSKSDTLRVTAEVTARPWTDVLDQAWLEAVEEMTWQEDVNPSSQKVQGWYLGEQCPRCKHSKVYGYVAAAVVRTGLAETRATDQSDVIGKKEFVRCVCGAEHPGRPSGEDRGCGQSSTVEVRL